MSQPQRSCNPQHANQPLFALGQLVATPRALEAFQDQDHATIHQYLIRHQQGDWGELCDEDKQANDDAVLHGGRILSSYLVDHQKVWIITEADRSVTTFLLPSEY
jgi:hypothetical protein